MAPVFKTSSTIIIDLFLISSNEISSLQHLKFFPLIDKETKIRFKSQIDFIEFQLNF